MTNTNAIMRRQLPTPEQRKDAQQRLPALTAAREQAAKVMMDRRQTVLAADQQYQELVAAYKAAKRCADDAFSIALPGRVSSRS